MLKRYIHRRRTGTPNAEFTPEAHTMIETEFWMQWPPLLSGNGNGNGGGDSVKITEADVVFVEAFGAMLEQWIRQRFVPDAELSLLFAKYCARGEDDDDGDVLVRVVPEDSVVFTRLIHDKWQRVSLCLTDFPINSWKRSIKTVDDCVCGDVVYYTALAPFTDFRTNKAVYFAISSAQQSRPDAFMYDVCTIDGVLAYLGPRAVAKNPNTQRTVDRLCVLLNGQTRPRIPASFATDCCRVRDLVSAALHTPHSAFAMRVLRAMHQYEIPRRNHALQLVRKVNFID